MFVVCLGLVCFFPWVGFFLFVFWFFVVFYFTMYRFLMFINVYVFSVVLFFFFFLRKKIQDNAQAMWESFHSQVIAAGVSGSEI